LSFLTVEQIISVGREFLSWLGAIGGIAFIRNLLIHPNVLVYDCRLTRSYPMDSKSPHVTLSWRIHNRPRLWRFGDNLVDMYTKFFIGRGDKGNWHWTGTVKGPALIPIKERTFQEKRWINEDFPEDEYRLYFIIYSNNKRVKTHPVTRKIEDI